MAIIRSGLSTTELGIDTNSNAARISQYDSSGNRIISEPVGVYMLPINLGRLTAIIAANSAIWTMRNTDTKTIRILDIEIHSAFDGTAVSTSALYNIVRFNTATPTGGTAMTVIKASNDFSNSAITDARYNPAAALTVTSVVFETPLAGISNPRQVNSTSYIHLKGNEIVYNTFELASGEGLAIRLGVDSVVGDVISGYVRWMELQ